MPRKPDTRPAVPQNGGGEYPKMVRGPQPGQKRIVSNADEERAAIEAFEAEPVPTLEVSAPQDFDALKAGTLALAARLNVELLDGASAEDDLEMIALALEERATATFGETETVEIPDDWRDQHHSTIIALADRLSDADVSTKADAIAVIEAEIERRGNA